jgi:phage shock protein A
MSILKNIMTAIRGGASEVGEAVVDANAVRILEQEVRDAQTAIGKAKNSLREMKATEISLNRKVNTLDKDISGLEDKAVACLNQGNEALAGEVAERIAEKETERDELDAEHLTTKVSVNKVNQMIKAYEKRIQKSKRDLDKIKTVEQLQKATSSISTNMAATGSADSKVNAALERVKAKQQRYDDKLEASDWMSDQGDDLDKKLVEAGLGDKSSGSAAVLERLKSKNMAG